MIKVENVDVFGWKAAIRGMRNPMNSWEKSDSYTRESDREFVHLGKNDLNLMRRLYKGGTEHRKYSRMINVTADITSHHAWWAEFDTYKVGTVRNSCSKMHRIHIKEFVPDDFSHEGIDEVGAFAKKTFNLVVSTLETLRVLFNKTHKKKYWRAIIELLPMGYNIKATVQLSYENVFSMIKQRSGHKLDEWNEFVKILLELPYIKEIMEVRYETDRC